MEKLANLTQADINNGVLNRMLTHAGISNVEEYVKNFNQEVEELIVEEFKNPDPNQTDFDEPIATPADIQGWVTHLQLRLDDDPVKPTTTKHHDAQKEQPKDLKSFMQRMAPTVINTPSEDAIPHSQDSPALTGNMSTWLTGWSKSLAEKPPPKSLNDWLNGLVPQDMNEPTGKASTSKSRLNTYLNAAEKVLAERGYDVSNTATPKNDIQAKVGMFGNVKQMYFLWKTLDKNNDRKITVEDVQIMLAEMGLGFLSKYVAETLFNMVDSNHDGQLQFRDFVALMGITKQLVTAVGSK